MEKLIEQFSRIPQKQKFGLLVAVVLLMGIGFYFLVYDDQSIRLENKQQELQHIEADLVEKQAIAENLSKYTQEVDRLKVELDKAKSLLPDESEVPALLAQINTLAGKAGLTIARFEPQSEETKDFYARLPFHLKVSGDYHEIASFIDSVGHLERIVNVENIAMKEPTMKNKKFLLDTDFTVTTYRFIDKPAPPAEGTALAPAGAVEEGATK